MENSKTTFGKNTCNNSNTRIYPGENNELICLKVYTGDWGDWDEKPEHCNPNIYGNSEKIINDNIAERR